MHVHAAPTGEAQRKMQNVLRFSLVLTLAYVVVTLVAGIRAHSLALISEADTTSRTPSPCCSPSSPSYFQSRPATDAKTFGYQRAGVLAAFVNATTLLVLSVWIAIEAIHRLASPEPVQPKLMMYVATAGVLMNGFIALLLSRVNTDVNIRSALIHMLGDTLSTAAVIVGGAAILFTGRTWIDPVLSVIIAALILWSSLSIVARPSTSCSKARQKASPCPISAPPCSRSPASKMSTTCTSGASAPKATPWQRM